MVTSVPYQLHSAARQVPSNGGQRDQAVSGPSIRQS